MPLDRCEVCVRNKVEIKSVDSVLEVEVQRGIRGIERRRDHRDKTSVERVSQLRVVLR